VPDSWRAARVTLAIAAITILCWLILWLGGPTAVVAYALAYGFAPSQVSIADAEGIVHLLLTPLTATLIHGGAVHILVNMLGLLVCGRIVETIVGGRGMIILYLAGAYAAAASQYAVAPNDAHLMIGAGGPVSAVIGAYAILLGRNKLRVARPSRGLWLNALWLAAAWIGIQALVAFAYGVPAIHIAYAAFAGGFLIGLALAKPLLLLRWRGA
jgi:membrane associated rhomboid family serine protease